MNFKVSEDFKKVIRLRPIGSKSTIIEAEKGVLKVNNKDVRMTSLMLELINLEHISYLFLVLLLLKLSMYFFAGNSLSCGQELLVSKFQIPRITVPDLLFCKM